MVRLLITFFLGFCVLQDVNATARIKDISVFDGIRANFLIGYGIVVGLNGTGDSSASFTKESLANTIERLGVNVPAKSVSGKNVAAVMVTAKLKPFLKMGSELDIVVSTVGDAKDLKGGNLLATPLIGADGNVYAVAQGPVTAEGYQAVGNDQTRVFKGVPTTAKMIRGAIVEREIPFDLKDIKQLALKLRNPDFTTAMRVSHAINEMAQANIAMAKNSYFITINPLEEHKKNLVEFMAAIEKLRIMPDQIARVVVDESSGVIIVGQGVRVSRVAIAQGTLSVKIDEQNAVSQPNALGGGQTTTTANSEVGAQESGTQFKVLESGVSLQELVSGLNALGIGPRDLIPILLNLKTAGALQAELEVR